MMRNTVLLLLVIGLILIFSVPAESQTFTVLHSFNGVDGKDPTGALTLSGSTLYGMSTHGGRTDYPSGFGAIFSIPVTGGDLTSLFKFDSAHGVWPYGGLTLSGSTLYGTTFLGGPGTNGTVFSIPVTGGTPTILTNFDSTTKYPVGNLTLIDSTLYGRTSGGVSHGIFSIPVTGGAPTALSNLNELGEIPSQLSLTQSGASFYGVIKTGGGPTYGSTIFSVPVTGGAPTTLYTFSDEVLDGNLTLSGSTLYGMSHAVSGHPATIFSFPVSGGGLTTLYTFSANESTPKNGSLIISGSTLYGMTSNGGAYGYGSIFSIPVTGGTPTTLFSFNNTNGAGPIGSLTLSGSTLYGETAGGGVYGYGTIFAITIPEPSTIVLLLTAGFGGLFVFKRL